MAKELSPEVEAALKRIDVRAHVEDPDKLLAVFRDGRNVLTLTHAEGEALLMQYVLHRCGFIGGINLPPFIERMVEEVVAGTRDKIADVLEEEQTRISIAFNPSKAPGIIRAEDVQRPAPEAVGVPQRAGARQLRPDRRRHRRRQVVLPGCALGDGLGCEGERPGSRRHHAGQGDEAAQHRRRRPRAGAGAARAHRRQEAGMMSRRA